MKRELSCGLLAVCFLLLLISLACQSEGEGNSAETTPPNTHRVDTALSADSVPIYYEAHGAGDTTLVFVHGWGIDAGFWEHQVAAFDDSFTVVTLDLAGHGRSGNNRSDWTPAAYAADVVAVLEAADVRHAFLIGHSMGGTIIAEIARMAPDRVIALIGVDTYQSFSERWTPEQAEQFLAPFRENYDSSVEWFARVMLPENVDTAIANRIIAAFRAGDPDSRIATLANLFVHDEAQTMRAVGKPVRAISSDAYPTNLDSNRAIVPSFEVKLMSGVGHFLFIERPDEFNRLLGETLAELRSPPVE